MHEQLGNGAALFSCFLWSMSILMFQPLLRRHGAPGCNLYKSCVASLLFALTSAVLLAAGVATMPNARDAGMLLCSGLVGMAIGDFAFFESMVRIGARQTTLVQSTSPVFLLLFSIWNPDEQMGRVEIIGVVLVVLGVMEVTRRQRFREPTAGKAMIAGTLLALVSALAQAIGIILSKEALADSHPVLASNCRLLGAALGMYLGMLLLGRHRRAVAVFRDRAFLKDAFTPAFLGTYLGILTMMFAIGAGKTAVAGALLSLTPVFMVPVAAWREKTRIDWGILFGTCVAGTGAFMVCL
ncbi:MAG: DMT family transporter [Planctomycetes bacterium]|nr:DMT family transporter [Planctomycetota bacterium]